MMYTPFPPRREADLVTWGLNFNSKINLSPTSFGLSATQATAFGVLYDLFVTSYNVAQSEATRSPMNVSQKDIDKANLVANIRLLAGIVQRFPGTTNPMRLDLGLPQRGTVPAPIPIPSESPLIEIKETFGRTARLRLINRLQPTRRGKPAGTIGASVFSFVGSAPPPSTSDWKFEGSTGHTTFDVVFPDSVPAGATVWLTAFWMNPRKQSGNACDPISTNLPGGSVSQVA